jgi:hypothetical protein
MMLAVVMLATACPPPPPPQPTDYQAPVVQSVVSDPPVATAGVPFRVTVVQQLCEESSRSAISPTVYEYVHQCDANPALLPGSYRGEFLESFNDRFMNRLSPTVDLELVAAG